ncbi:MAG: GNAT family N-acetyltransferase, partial [Oscillospiraceae bacterium]
EESIGESTYAKGYLIECNGEVAGYGLISLTFSGEVGGLVVLLEELYIKEEFQGKGLGTEYFSFIENLYKDAKRFRLEVTKVNAGAIKLYTRLGYSEISYKQMIKEK